MRILFAGGGTGGHLYPALAVAKFLRQREPGFECLFLGSPHGLEREIVPREGFELRVIPGSGFRRLGLAARLRSFVSLVRGFFAASVLLRRWKPDVVMASGGYASLAGGLAAIAQRRPLCVQEQNSVPGLVSRLLGGWARRVFVGFPDTEHCFRKPDRVVYVGNPVREDLLAGAQPLRDLPVDQPVILVLGGSRGARSLNHAVDDAVARMAEKRPVTWLWQTGRLDHAALTQRWDSAPNVRLWDYLSDVGAAYVSATLLVCRAGAMTLAEITALGKPAILVPFPGAVDDHQTRNARHLVDAGAAILVPDGELSGERLTHELEGLLGAPERLQRMSESSYALGPREATSRIAATLLQLASGEEGGERDVRQS